MHPSSKRCAHSANPSGRDRQAADSDNAPYSQNLSAIYDERKRIEALRRRHTEGVVLAAHGLRIAARPVSHRIDSTRMGGTDQASPEPTPMTLTAEQVRPTGTLISWATTPMLLRIGATATLPAGSTDWQHWTGPVAQLAPKAGVAAARSVKANKAKSLLNMMSEG